MIHILLPAFNEAPALGSVLMRTGDALNGRDFRIWVVDDGSQDETVRVAGDWSSRLPIRVLSHAHNEGLGRAMATGLEAIVPILGPEDVVVSLDADNSHPPELIPALVMPVLGGRSDVVIASRFVHGGRTIGVPPFRRLTSWGVRILYRLFLPLPGVYDYSCGFRAYRGSLLKAARDKWGGLVTEKGFSCMIEILARLSTLSPRFEEVPLILHYDQKASPSKMPVMRTIGSTLRLLWRLKHQKPRMPS